VDPDIIRQLFAQQDATAFNPGTGARASTMSNMLGIGLDLAPGIGDVKAVAEAPGLFSSGHPFAGALSLASAVPFFGAPLDILRSFAKNNRVFRGAEGRSILSITNPAVVIDDLEGETLFFSKGATSHSDVLFDPENFETISTLEEEGARFNFGFLDSDGGFRNYREATDIGKEADQLPSRIDHRQLTSESFDLIEDALLANEEKKKALDLAMERRKLLGL
jgi:hypothetical protein